MDMESSDSFVHVLGSFLDVRMRSERNPPRRFLTPSTTDVMNLEPTTDWMDLELLSAATTSDDVTTLINALNRVSTEKNLALSHILDQVSPTRNTLLHLCVIHGNSDGAALIACHFPTLIARPNSQGNTVMHLAARAGNRNLLETLVGIKAAMAGNRDLAQHLIGRAAYSELVKTLVGTTEDFHGLAPADDWCNSLLRLTNKEGNTPLHEAITHGCSSDVASLLIGSDPRALYVLNGKKESPLYLAAKAGDGMIVESILIDDSQEDPDRRFIGKSAVHVAVRERHQGVLEILLMHEPKLILLKDEAGRTPVHLATSLGYLEEVKYLLGKNKDSVSKRDNNGLLPIHLAAIKGHINLVELLLKYWPDPCELLSSNGQNILHVAVTSGGHDMVCYILGTTMFKELINMRDDDGNTPLHLAAKHWHPRIVSTLTWDNRVDLNSVNTEGKTALDCAEDYEETTPSFRMQLTWAALKSGGVPRAYKDTDKDQQRSTKSNQSSMESYKDRVNTLLLVAILVATVTFAAGFTMPGGFNNSKPDLGMATMLKNWRLHVFVFCDTIALYSSIIVSIVLIWAQLGDLNLVLTALRLALPLLGVSLSMMTLSFTAGVYLVVSNLRWLAIAVLITAFVLQTILATLFFFVCVPISSNNRFLRYISYYPFRLVMLVTKHYN